MTADLRIAFRMLRRQPGLTMAAVLTLALGIGANVTVFGIVRTVLLGPLPMADAERLVSVTERRPTSRNADLPVSAHEFVAWQEQNRVFESIALYQPDRVSLTGVPEPATIDVLRVSPDYFALLRLTAARGRVISAGDGAAPAVVVLSEQFWRRRFSAQPDVLGRTITLNDQPFTVIGVMPPLPPSLAPDVWLPLDVAAEARAVGRHHLSVLARLADGITIDQADADLDAIATRLEAALPDQNTDHRVSITSLREALVGQFRRPLLLLTIAVALVLLIACANVANLLLAAATRRQRELIVRSALGASRWRIARQLLVESLTLSALGGAAGLLIALWAIDVATRLTAVSIPLLETARLDWQALLVAVAVSLFAGIAAGLAPSLRSQRASSMLRVGTHSIDVRGRRLRASLVAAEVALTLMLLVATGLMTNSFVRLMMVDPGFDTRDIVVVPVDLPSSRYGEAHQVRAFVDDLVAELHALPGVRAAGAVSHLPLGGADNWMNFTIVGRVPPLPGQEPNAPFRVATPGYFETMGIPLRRGRGFTAADARSALPLIRWYPQQPYPEGYDRAQPAPVAVISESAAKQFWPDEDPIGKQFNVLFSPAVTIVGVVGDVKHNALDLPAYPQIYLSHNQEPWGSLSVVLRVARNAAPLIPTVRDRLRARDPQLPIAIREMTDVRADSIDRPRFFLLLIGLFGAVALGLALVGIFGVVSYVVMERTREIGVRVALGAQRREILALIVGQGMRPIIIGLAAGVVAATLLARFIATLLYDVPPVDALTFAVVSALLAAAALLACLLPALRAARLDPIAALRSD